MDDNNDIRGLRATLLDGKGYVQVVDTMGSDADIAASARVSYASGTKKSRNDERLIRHLMKHRHTSPFEQCEVKFEIKVPLYVWQQWLRHRTANVNQESHRYSTPSKEFHVISVWREQDTVNKQGSVEAKHIDQTACTEMAVRAMQFCFDTYDALIAEGVCREQARIVLPVGTYTKAVWKIDLHNLFNFIRLRTDPAAQEEIRVYAEAISEFVRLWVPMAYAAFEEFVLNENKGAGNSSVGGKGEASNESS